ncbi:MAG TPA: hypothetical protein VGX94_01285 [Terriglobia bacterium]|nr:hypothetical protein [Terriglobia bacterium]
MLESKQTEGSLDDEQATVAQASPPTAAVNQGDITRAERFEVLKLEISLLQSRFDKFDGLIFQMRGWLITIVAGLLGAAISLKNGQLTFLAAGAAILFYFLETLWRQNWFKYVIRYRRIRDALHRGEGIRDLTPYDLTDFYGNRPGWYSRLWNNLWSFERFLFCGSLALGSLVVHALM